MKIQQTKTKLKMKKQVSAIHYALNGEWGGERVRCNRYYTCDIRHTGDKRKITCKWCKRNIL